MLFNSFLLLRELRCGSHRIKYFLVVQSEKLVKKLVKKKVKRKTRQIHSSNSFDVTMGSFDGAETCELVGSYLLNHLPRGIKNHVGFYRDDGLGAFQLTPRRIEGIKKDICKVFSDNGLKITIEANK